MLLSYSMWNLMYSFYTKNWFSLNSLRVSLPLIGLSSVGPFEQDCLKARWDLRSLFDVPLYLLAIVACNPTTAELFWGWFKSGHIIIRNVVTLSRGFEGNSLQTTLSPPHILTPPKHLKPYEVAHHNVVTLGRWSHFQDGHLPGVYCRNLP